MGKTLKTAKKPATEELALEMSRLKIPGQVVHHSDYGRKAEEIAPLFGVKKDAVLKTLTFLNSAGKACLVLVPMNRTIDEGKLAAVFGPGARLAKAAEVHALTKHEIGGVPITANLPLFVDSSCLANPEILVSAGHPEVSVKLASSDLFRLRPDAKKVDFSAPEK
jgi:prolyl-tRNA editing enzyme YbaK/EbsC (Cys-tRNA(Pro) deacylase)